MNQFGLRIKSLRIKKGLLQRHIANQLDMDSPMLSKIERGERHAKRAQVTVLSKIFKVPVEDLLFLWLADKVYGVVKDEPVAIKAIEATAKVLKGTHKKKT